MATTQEMHVAKARKKDDFFTDYSVISDEMGNYRSQLKGQIVYCNCDDPSSSNFWKYFHSNFASLGLKRLIATHYQKDSEPSYAMVYDGGDDFNLDAGVVITIHGNKTSINGKEIFYTAGDFRSDACINFLKEATVVSTNPPFSLFVPYIKQLVSYNKKFIIIGNINSVSTKELFPLIIDNKVWLGASIHSGDRKFFVPDTYPLNAAGCGIDENGKRFIRVKGVRWFTNMDVKYRHDGLWHKNGAFDNAIAHCYYENRENYYPVYDNYNAIEVSNTKDIPIDYPGVMGVPVTWLDKYNPDEFIILGCSQRGCHDLVPDTKKYNSYWEVRQDGSRTGASGNKTNENPNLCKNDGKHNYFINANGHIVQSAYTRIFIQNKNPIKKSDDLGY